MTSSQHLFAEFETLGEIEVNNRVEHKVYDEPTRAYALRWLNEKAIERAGASHAENVGRQMSLHELTRKAQGSAQMSMLVATVATVAAILSAGAAYQAMRVARSAVEHSQILAASVTTSTPAPLSPRRHRAP